MDSKGAQSVSRDGQYLSASKIRWLISRWWGKSIKGISVDLLREFRGLKVQSTLWRL